MEDLFFIIIVFLIPVYGYCIWSLYEPEESFFFLERWKYKEVPELSVIQIKLIRIVSVVVMIIMTISLIALAISTFTPTPPLPDIKV